MNNALWCLRCAHPYKNRKEAEGTTRCPKCGGAVFTNKQPTLTSTLVGPIQR